MRAQVGVRIIVKALIAAYLITGGLLLLTAFLLYKMEPGQSLVTAGIQVIYVLSSVLGGVLAGKGMKTKRFLWGMLTGLCYYLLLLAVSALTGGISSGIAELSATFLLCLGGGMLGGMLS